MSSDQQNQKDKIFSQESLQLEHLTLDDQAANGIAPIYVNRVNGQTESMRLAVQAHLEYMRLLLWHLIAGASSWE